LIAYLDQNNSKWRKNKKDVQVYFPWKNDTTNAGLKKLKREIGKKVYPLISSGKDLSLAMKLAFPNTLEGMELQKAFDLHIKEGEPITLKGDVIQELKFSDWWEVWFGGLDLKHTELHIGEISQQQAVLISFKIIPNKGKTISLPNLEFRTIRVGTELIKFSNEHTSCPLLINLTLRREETGTNANQTFRFRHVGGDPHEILNFTDFVSAIEIGGKLRLEFHDMKQSYTTDFPPGTVSGLDLKFYDLVRKLCLVQDKTGHFFRIPDQGFSSKDAQAILELYEIVEKGKLNYKSTSMTLELTAEGLKMFLDTHKQGLPIHLKMTTPESYVELFGEEIQTGPMIRETTGFIEMNIPDIEMAMNSLDFKETLVLKLVNVNGSETFSNWLPKE